MTYHRLDIGVRDSVKHLEFELKLGSKVDIGTLVLRRITVFGCRKDGDTPAIMLDLVSLHAHLVRSDDSLQTVVLTESLGNIRSKLQAHTTLTGSASILGLRVGPEHLHHQAMLARLPLAVAIEFPDVVQCNLVIGEETTVQDQVLVTNQSSQGEGGEGLGEDLEDALIILGLAFTLKSVDLVHIVGLMVTAVEEQTVRPQPLVCV